MAYRRIGFDGRYINDRYHGVGRYAFRLLESLIEAGVDDTFVVFTGQAENTRFDWTALSQRPNVELKPGPWPLYWPQEQLSWRALIRRNRLDLFHSPYFVAPLLSPVPVIITVHDLIFDRYPQFMPLSWTRPYYRLLMRLSTRKASRMVSVSRSTAADLQHYYAVGVDKIVLAGEGAEASFQPLDDRKRLRDLREKYGLQLPFVLTVGARRPHKNHVRLLQAYHQVQQQVPHSLVFVGPVDERFGDYVYLAAKTLGLDGRVRFLDWVPEVDLPGLYNLADLVVLPSLIEGFGLPALEAMACGTPVMAADNTSFPEVVGESGMLVDPYDTDQLAGALHSLLLDGPLRKRMSVEGRLRAGLFTWENPARTLLDVYASVHAGG